MRYRLPLLLLVISLFACEDTAVTTFTNNPDQPAADDEKLMVKPQAIQSEIVFPYDGILWSFRFLPDGRLIATDRSGKIILTSTDGNLLQTITEGLPTVKAESQGGLLDILLDPDFSSNRLLYLTYSKPEASGKAGTAVGRARLSEDEKSLDNFEVLYEMGNKSYQFHHYGSRMAWGPDDGYLYFSIGDRGNREENPQDTTRDGGKIYRITRDGGIPPDNPFVGYPNVKEAIYSYGHRNPQSLTAHPETGEIWSTEHGPRGGDEVNIISAGLNYGWPVVTYGINYDGSQITQKVSQPGMVQPIHYWVPSIAPSGMTFITGDRYPGWEGDLLVGSLSFSHVQHINLEGETVVGQSKVLNQIGRVRDLRMGPDGYAYASVESQGIVRLVVE